MDIDKLVRNALFGHKPEYKNEVWKGIESRLNAIDKPANVIPSLWLWMAALLIIGLAGGGGYYLGVHSAQNQNIALSKSNQNIERNQTISQATLTPSNQNKGDKSQIASNTRIESNESPQAFFGLSSSINAPVIKDFYANSYKPRVENTNHRANRNASIGKSKNIENQNITSDKALVIVKEKLNTESTPALYASRDNISIAPIQLPIIEEQIHQTSLDIVEENAKKTYPMPSWQNILYNFWNNPAYTGSEAKYTFNSQARFVAFDKEYKPSTDYALSFDTKINKLNSGIGVYAIRSISPSLATNTLGLAYSYNIALGQKSELRLGTGGSMTNYHSYYSSSHYTGHTEVSNSFLYIPNGEPLAITTRVLGADVGAWYKRPNWMAGFSVKDFNQPIYKNQTIPAHYIFAGGYNANLGAGFQLIPWVEIHRINDIYRQQASLMLGFANCIMLGVNYQNISPNTEYGDFSFYLSGDISRRLRIFSAYGYTSQELEPGSRHRILHSGIRYQIN